jgi:hypothetical protein
METEQKTQMVESLESIKALMAKWERVKEIAEDVAAYIQKNARRFRVEISSAVGTKVIYGYMSGTEKYAVYGEELNDMTFRQILERFFNDDKVLPRMVQVLAEAIKEVAEQNIKELEEQIQ